MEDLVGERRRPKKGSLYAEKFAIMLRVISHPDGGSWTGTKMERATGGAVSTSYFSSLVYDQIEVPRADKIEVIAEAMGFPPGLWFKSLKWWEEARENWEKGRGLGAVLETERPGADAERLRRLIAHLFETRVNEASGEPFTNKEVVVKSAGVLTEEDVAAMRDGRQADPTLAQALALGCVFGVDASYWSGRDPSSWQPSPTVLEAVEGMDSYLIFQNSMQLTQGDRSALRMLAEHLRREREGQER